MKITTKSEDLFDENTLARYGIRPRVRVYKNKRIREVFKICSSVGTYKGAKDLLLISNFGRLFSCNENAFINQYTKSDGGYRIVTINYGNRVRRNIYIHKLVATEFCPIENMGQMKVKIIDGNNNKVCPENLQWVTQFELSIINSINEDCTEETIEKCILKMVDRNYNFNKICEIVLPYMDKYAKRFKKFKLKRIIKYLKLDLPNDFYN